MQHTRNMVVTEEVLYKLQGDYALEVISMSEAVLAAASREAGGLSASEIDEAKYWLIRYANNAKYLYTGLMQSF